MRRRIFATAFAPFAAYLLVQTGVALLVARPPLLGWIGLAVAVAVAVAVAAAAATLGPRLGVNADRCHPHGGPVRRLLVVLEGAVPPWRLREAVVSRVRGRPHEVLVVSPAVGSLLHFLADDEERERRQAAERLDRALQLLGGAGIAARGAVGADDPIEAIGDALATFPADEILVLGPRRGSRRVLERDLERRARDAFGVHTETA